MTGPAGGARLIIVCGLPGAGKTTLATELEARTGAIRLDADAWMEALAIDLRDETERARIEALQWSLGQALLKRGLVVIIEWGTWGRSERDALRLGARALGAAVELRYVSAPPEVLFERIRRRDREDPPVSREEVARWVTTFEAPTGEETALYDPPRAPGRDGYIP